MRHDRVLALAAILTALSGPAWAGDLTYQHHRDGPDLLERSDGQPYWLLLGECAGFYGALANVATSEGDYDRDLAEGVRYFNSAVARLRADRQLDRAGAVALLEPRVTQARRVGESSLAQASGGSLTPEQILRSTCGSVDRIYRTAGGS